MDITAQSKYILYCNQELNRASLDSAVAQAGVIEATGNNDGAKIKLFLNSVGLGLGNPYCAAGQYYCFLAAAGDLNINAGCIPIKRTGLANEMFNYARNFGKNMKIIPMPGDMLVWRRAGTPFGHIERIVSVLQCGWVRTIAFNVTGKLGNIGRIVHGVFFKKRNIYHPLGRLTIRGMIGFYSIGLLKIVIPTKVGIYCSSLVLDSRLHGNDKNEFSEPISNNIKMGGAPC